MDTKLNDKARIGYCPYHQETKLDDFAECPECEKELYEYGQFRSGKSYNPNNRLIKMFLERGEKNK